MRAWSWETGYNLLALPLLFHCSTQVQFVGKEAVDTGGPTREFWRLFIQEVVRHYCVGDSGMCLFAKNIPALEVSVSGM